MTDPTNIDHPGYWSDRYRTGRAGWDLGTPTPVFGELLRTAHFRPGRLLLPGCGTGHDAVAFARAGFTVTGVDFAPEPLAEARALAARHRVKVEFLQADFFSMGHTYARAFDYVVEYVTYCAIDPARRPEYAGTVSLLLKPGGLFIALFFPVESRPDGPPFGVDLDEVERLLLPSFRLLSREMHPATIAPRRGREVLTVWERTT